MKKVSVVIPVYQVEQYLERCVDSILNQTYPEIEIILVDDGSKDRSGEICDRYSQKFSAIHTIHKANGGLSSARNTGIRAGQGEYLLFIDSDDVLHPETIEKEMDALEKTGAQIAICQFDRFARNEDISSFEPLKESDIEMYGSDDVIQNLFDQTNAGPYVSSCGKLFPKTYFQDISFPEGRIFEDEFVTYRLYEKAQNIARIKKPCYFYFYNESGLTSNLDLNKRFDEYDAQYERAFYFIHQGSNEIAKTACLEFLRWTQWDLIEYQTNPQKWNPERGDLFQRQYRNILKAARNHQWVGFQTHYDYFVLAYPQYKQFLRIRRFVLKQWDILIRKQKRL